MCVFDMLIVAVQRIISFVHPNLDCCKTNSLHVSSKIPLLHYHAENVAKQYVTNKIQMAMSNEDFVNMSHSPIVVVRLIPSSQCSSNIPKNFDKNLMMKVHCHFDSKNDYLNNLMILNCPRVLATIWNLQCYYWFVASENSMKYRIQLVESSMVFCFVC